MDLGAHRMQGAQSVTQRCCLVTRGGCTPSGGARSTLLCRSAAAAFQMILAVKGVCRSWVRCPRVKSYFCEDQKIFTALTSRVISLVVGFALGHTLSGAVAARARCYTVSSVAAAQYAFHRTPCNGCCRSSCRSHVANSPAGHCSTTVHSCRIWNGAAAEWCRCSWC